MSGVMDYLRWRGDLDLNHAPFNEVDGLILSMITYADFVGIVPDESDGGEISLRAAVKAYFSQNATKKVADGSEMEEDGVEQGLRAIPLGVIVPGEVHKLLLKMAATVRYRDLSMSRHTCEWQESGEDAMQFAALTFRYKQSTTIVVFRGTDDTLTGCREDLNLSFMDEVPSQRRATEYLNALYGSRRKMELYVCGHSKGGNLAVWSAVHALASVRKQIKQVYNFDGPGFSSELLQSAEYGELNGRITTLVPQSSLVGLLLENDGKYQIVKSTQKGIFQHNGLGWAVDGTSFVRMRTLSREGVKNDTVTRRRIESMTMEERRTLTRLIFEVVESTGAHTLSELSEAKLKHSVTMLKTINEYDKATRALLVELLLKLFVSRKALKQKEPKP